MTESSEKKIVISKDGPYVVSAGIPLTLETVLRWVSMSNPERDDTLVLDLLIHRPPDSVRRWWTDLPDDYTAKDPREQPYRILTVKSTSNGREMICYWRSPDGTERQTQETLHLKDDGSWSFDVIHPAGFHILDEFHAVPIQERTRLEIRSRLTPLTPGAESVIAVQKQRMAEGWKVVAEICERDAP